MDKDTTQTKLYEHYLSIFLPEGMLDFFELVWMETESLTSKESQKDIAYTGVLHIHLDERDNRTGGPAGLALQWLYGTYHNVGFPCAGPEGVTAHPQAAVAYPGWQKRDTEHLSACRRRDSVLRSVCRVLEKKLGYDPGDSTLPW